MVVGMTGVVGSYSLPHLVGTDRPGGIGAQFVVGVGDLCAQPGLDRPLLGEQRTESVPNDLALTGVGARCDALAEGVGHAVRQGNAQLPRRPHDQPPRSRTKSYSWEVECRPEAVGVPGHWPASDWLSAPRAAVADLPSRASTRTPTPYAQVRTLKGTRSGVSHLCKSPLGHKITPPLVRSSAVQFHRRCLTDTCCAVDAVGSGIVGDPQVHGVDQCVKWAGRCP